MAGPAASAFDDDDEEEHSRGADGREAGAWAVDKDVECVEAWGYFTS